MARRELGMADWLREWVLKHIIQLDGNIIEALCYSDATIMNGFIGHGIRLKVYPGLEVDFSMFLTGL